MLTESVKQKIIEYLASQTNVQEWNFVGNKIESTDCYVYRLSSPFYLKDIAVKIYHSDKTLKINKHYSAIKRFSVFLNKPKSKYRVPEPYGLISDNHMFLMEWIEGETLKNKLWRNCFSKVNLQRFIKDAFIWLKCFHKHANPIIKKVDINSYTKNIELHSQLSSISNGCLDDPIFITGVEILNRFSQQFFDYETMHVDIHGDLNLSNIIINENHITGIDISAYKSEPIEHDITQMLNYICVNYFNMLTRFDIHKPQDTWEIFNVALDAYEYPKEKKSRDFLLFVFLYQMLYRWISIRKTHSLGKEKTLTFFFLGKWRLYNSSVIVKSLTKMINEKYLDKNVS